jgi:hypothetical protein
MNLITQDKWGMRIPKRSNKHTPNTIVIHHVGSGNYPLHKSFDGINSIKSIESYHIDHNKWWAIGYHYMIAPNGDIYEGRKSNTVGAHVGGQNTGKIGINVYGNFGAEEPTSEQLKAITELCTVLIKKYKKIKSNSIVGHRDLDTTECPGDNLYKKLPEIKRNVKELLTKNSIISTLNDQHPVISEISKTATKQSEIRIVNKTGNIIDTEIYIDGKLNHNITFAQITLDANTSKVEALVKFLNPIIDITGEIK